MKAFVLEKIGSPLQLHELPMPQVRSHQVLIKVHACGICRTDLHIIDGDLPTPNLPLILGHQIVGTVVEVGKATHQCKRGDRIGIPWLGSTCGHCHYCDSQRENLCDNAGFTGYHIHGGFAEYAVADERFCFHLPEGYAHAQAAPLLCAGMIGFRALSMCGAARRIGFYGFGAAAHILTQVVSFSGAQVYAFTRENDLGGQSFARSLGAVWAGDVNQKPPEGLDAAIIFAPVGELVLKALAAVVKGGRVVCAGIHMSAIPPMAYEMLWGERSLMSVANLTRRDGETFLALAGRIRIQVAVDEFQLAAVNEAVRHCREGKSHGAKVLTVTDD